jgi:Fe-S-cluster containining protein
VVLLPGEGLRAVHPDEPPRWTSTLLASGRFVYHTTGGQQPCPYFEPAVLDREPGCSIWENRPVLCRTFPLRPMREQWAGPQAVAESAPSVVTNVRFKIMPVCPAFRNWERMKFHVLRWARLWQDIEPLLPAEWWNFYGAWHDDGWVSTERWLQREITAPIDLDKAKFPPRRSTPSPDARVVITCADHNCHQCNGRGIVTSFNPTLQRKIVRLCECAVRGYEDRRTAQDLGSRVFTRFGDWGVRSYTPPPMGLSPHVQLSEQVKQTYEAKPRKPTNVRRLSKAEIKRRKRQKRQQRQRKK